MTRKTPPSSLAAYATLSSSEAHRAHQEPVTTQLDSFELDRHRIISCTAFRRLEGKSQVFAPDVHDHFRTRLTHTIEAAHIARMLANALHANESLAEAITLAHDLGHPPFGHAGEAALHEMMCDHEGFNHNAHSLRVVEYLEHPFPQFRGLNLTLATRTGLADHATPYDKPGVASHRASIESQIVSIADRIAYNTHDVEDALGADMIDIQQLTSLSIWHEASIRTGVDVIDQTNVFTWRRTIIDAIVQHTIDDIVKTTGALLLPENIDVHQTLWPSVMMSSGLLRCYEQLELFLQSQIYGHDDVAKDDQVGQQIVRRLFTLFRDDHKRLPLRFQKRVIDQGPERVVCDYIAGMTNRFCERQYQRLIENK